MMTLENMITALEAKGYEVVASTTIKNGVEKHGITIKGNANISPCIYEDSWNGIEDDYEAVAHVIDLYETNKLDDMDFSWFSDWETVKPLLKVKIQKATKENGIVKKKFLDMEERVIVNVPEIDGGTITIREDHIKMWDVTVTELIKTARENCKGNYFLKGMSQVMAEMMGMSPEELAMMGMPTDPADEQMYVLSNTEKVFGASGLTADKGIIKHLMNDLRIESCFILPSSIHEVLIVPDDGRMGLSDLEAMVKEVNATQVAPEEVLSDNVYYYSTRTGKVSKAS